MNNAIETLKKVLKNSDDRRLLFNIAGNYFVKGGAMLVSLLMMPAYMHYFQSNTVLGMWFTVVQLLNWIMLLDFGVGGGLRNKIIEPLKHANKNRVISLISAAYISVFAIVLMLIIFQYVLVGLVDWHKLLGVSPFDIQADTLKYMVHILIIGVSIRFFCVLIGQILYALQKAFLPGLLNLASSFLIMIYLVFAEPKGDDTDIMSRGRLFGKCSNQCCLPVFYHLPCHCTTGRNWQCFPCFPLSWTQRAESCRPIFLFRCCS